MLDASANGTSSTSTSVGVSPARRREPLDEVLARHLRQADGVELGFGGGGAERQLEQPMEDRVRLVGHAELVDEVGAQALGGQLGRVVGGDAGGPTHQLAEDRKAEASSPSWHAYSSTRAPPVGGVLGER